MHVDSFLFDVVALCAFLGVGIAVLWFIFGDD
jgi:hypothetical protein